MSSNEKSVFKPWQNLRRKHLLNSGRMADCYFVVGVKGKSKRFDCHKWILKLASPVLEAMLCGEFKDPKSPIPIPDVQPENFRLFLEFVYYMGEKENIKKSAEARLEEQDQGDTTMMSYDFETLQELLYLGKKFLIDSLEAQCLLAFKNKLLTECDEQCILSTFELAVKIGQTSLAQYCAERYSSISIFTDIELLYGLDLEMFCELIKLFKAYRHVLLKMAETYISKHNLHASDCVTVSGPEICKNCRISYIRKKNLEPDAQYSWTLVWPPDFYTNEGSDPFYYGEENEKSLENKYDTESGSNISTCLKQDHNLKRLMKIYESVELSVGRRK